MKGLAAYPPRLHTYPLQYLPASRGTSIILLFVPRKRSNTMNLKRRSPCDTDRIHLSGNSLSSVLVRAQLLDLSTHSNAVFSCRVMQAGLPSSSRGPSNRGQACQWKRGPSNSLACKPVHPTHVLLRPAAHTLPEGRRAAGSHPCQTCCPYSSSAGQLQHTFHCPYTFLLERALLFPDAAVPAETHETSAQLLPGSCQWLEGFNR